MTVANAFRAFFTALNGVAPTGKTVAEVIQSGTSSVQLNNESALATRVEALEEDKDFIVLNSSTAGSVKQFKITVVDNGTITATEIVEAAD
jgi:predicted RNase H-like HicB family nuclease